MLRVRCIKLHGERVVAEQILTVVQRVRDVRQPSEGYLDALTNEDNRALLRVLPANQCLHRPAGFAILCVREVKDSYEFRSDKRRRLSPLLMIFSRRIGCIAAALAFLVSGDVVMGQPPSAPGVIVAEVRTDRLVDRVEALGTLRAKESVTLTAAVTETVTAIGFDDGDRVEAGQTLVEMTSAEEHALLEEATGYGG